MRVLIYSEKIPPDYSGSGVRAIKHANWFCRNSNIKVEILTTTNTTDINDVIVNSIRLPGVEKRGNLKSLILNFIYLPIQVWRLISFFRKNNFNIVHSFGGGNIAFLLSILSNYFGYRYINEVILSPPDLTLKEIFNPARILRNISYSKADDIIAISPGVASYLNSVKKWSEKTIIIPNNVDGEIFKPIRYKDKIKVELGFQSTDFIILCVGRVSYRKGSDISIEIFNKIAEKYPNVKLIFIGEYKDLESSELLNIYSNKITSHIKKGRIILKGLVQDVNQYMCASDVLLFPSRREGLGNALLEAMACKLLIVSNRIPGITDYILTNEETGFIVENNNLNKYIEVFQSIIEKGEGSFISMKELAYQNYSSRFSDRVIFNSYSSLYNKYKNKQD